jgi:hypothetical protein
MVRTRSIWLACVTLGVLLALLAAGRAGAQPLEDTTATTGPAYAWTSQNQRPDAGTTWSRLPGPTPSSPLFDAKTRSGDTVYVAGQPATIMTTETGGPGLR